MLFEITLSHSSLIETVNVEVLKMYCIDTKVLVFMFNRGSSYGFTIHLISMP